MTIFYSPSKDACYPDEFKDIYQEAGTWPEDALEITDSEFSVFFLKEPPKGQVRAYKSNSGFSWSAISENLTEEQKIYMEKAWRDSELKRADEELNKVQDSDPKAVGTVGEWRNYRKLLRALPEQEGFPDSSVRPSAPDSV